MNEIVIELTEEEVTCIIAALGMTMDTTRYYSVVAKDIIKKLAREQFAEIEPIKVTMITKGALMKM